MADPEPPPPLDITVTAPRPLRLPPRPAPPPREGLPARLRLGSRFERLRVWLAASLEHDLDRGAGFAWMVVAFGCGAALYLALPQEPWLPAVAGLAVVMVDFAIRVRRRGGRGLVAVPAAAVACGLLAGQIQAERVAAPALDRERTVRVTGFVEEAEATANGGTRMIVRVVGMEAGGRAMSPTPTRIAATAQRGRDREATIGEGVRFLARLRPADGPVLPGGYDFARRAYFDGRGAAGYVLGRVERADLGPAPASLRAAAAIADLRHRMADRIRAALPGATGAVAAALLVGETRAIPPDAAEALRASGLTHIISISGLHMTLVGGTAFVVLRLLFASVPALALRRPIKKWAACGAFAAVTGYLLLSGGGVATERAYLMFAVGLAAILADRPVLTLRNVALSALLILVWQPSAVGEPSFLMSFLAVAALVAGFAAWRDRPRDPTARTPEGLAAHLVTRLLVHARGLVLSSVLAGLATAPVIAAEFHRAAPYGLLANLAVMPAIGLLVMPAGLAALVLFPFGLESLALAPMGWGIAYMLQVADAVAGWPGGAGLIGRVHPAMLPLAVFGILWLTLWTGRWRLLGLAPLAAALVVAPFARRPDIWIGPGAEPVAIRGADARIAILDARRNRFVTATWLAADADGREATDPALAGPWLCDALGCAARVSARDGGPDRVLAVVRDPRAFEEDCRLADVIVTRLEAPAGCSDVALVIDRRRLAVTGAVTLDWPDRHARRHAAADPIPGLVAALDGGSRPWRSAATGAGPTRPWTRSHSLHSDPAPSPDRQHPAGGRVGPGWADASTPGAPGRPGSTLIVPPPDRNVETDDDQTARDPVSAAEPIPDETARPE